MQFCAHSPGGSGVSLTYGARYFLGTHLGTLAYPQYLGLHSPHPPIVRLIISSDFGSVSRLGDSLGWICNRSMRAIHETSPTEGPRLWCGACDSQAAAPMTAAGVLPRASSCSWTGHLSTRRRHTSKTLPSSRDLTKTESLPSRQPAHTFVLSLLLFLRKFLGKSSL